MRLNLGCGDDIKDGYVNVDITKLPGVDVLADLNDSLPFKSESVDQIVMKSVLEHLNETEKVMRELFRILKAGGSLRITVPHAYSPNAFRDPTHKNFFTFETFDYFVNGHHANYYFDFGFRAIAERKLFFSRRGLRNRILEIIANRKPWLYENTILRMFPCLDLYVELTK